MLQQRKWKHSIIWQVSKKVLIYVLTITLLVGLVPMLPMRKVEAATVITEAEMTARVKDLAVRLGLDENLNVSKGIYFTKSGKTCCGELACSDNCNSTAVLSSDSAFVKHFDFSSLSTSKLPHHYGSTSGYTTAGASCCGFANFALWYVGKTDNTSNLSSLSNITKIAQGVPFNEANLRSYDLKIGDVIYCRDKYGGSHSAMFLGYESSGIKVLDCNWDTNDKVRTAIHIWSYTYSRYLGYNMGITRLANYQPDASLPSISNIITKDIDTNGFTVSCTVTDADGIEAVYFPVWTEMNGQDDLASIWPTGTSEGNNVYSFRVNVADHNNEYGVYIIHIYARDKKGVQAGPATAILDNTTSNPLYDKEIPVVTNAIVSSKNANGYTVTATATDNMGVVMMRFPTRRVNQTDDDWIWYEGTKNADGSWSKRIDKSEFDGVGGDYWTDVYAYDAAGNVSKVWHVQQYLDDEPPVIKNAKIVSVDGGGYTVECTVTDNVEVMKVQHATWTEKDGQDDLLVDWYDNPAASATANGNVYTFRVNDSDHNYERGKYTSHIYAYDTSWNYVSVGLVCDLQNNGVSVAEVTYNGHTYQIINDRLTWQEAKAACEVRGGHLVTITSAEEQLVLEKILPDEFTSTGYYIGGYTENGQSKWVTGETFNYTNWYPGEPNNWNEIEAVYSIYSRYDDATFTGKWNDVASNTVGFGYICEFEPVKVTGITLSETTTEVALGQTKTLEATVTPSGYHPSITWTSANPSIATVSGGVITGVAAGTTTITAECGGKTATCKVTVVKPFESISLNLTNKSLIKNESCSLKVNFTPADANADKGLTWKSSNPQVATISDNGVVTAVGEGSATITVSLKNNPKISATCTVKVSSYVVTFNTQGGSSIAPQKCGKGETIHVEAPIKDGYAFTGWYKDAQCTIPWDMENDIVSGNITLYSGWIEYHEGLWIVDIPTQQYTGNSIKPEVIVYHYAEKLSQGVDYTVSYKNNKNACDKDGVKAPMVIVKGKGNYSGTETATFTISAKNISDVDIKADNLFCAANGKVQKPSPIVTWNNKKLKAGVDFTAEYRDTMAGAYQNNGTYTVRIKGKGNFEGERTVKLQITGSNLLSKVQVTKISNQAYTGEKIEPEFIVKYGSTILVKDTDYKVSYQNNISVGTATVVLTGMGNYVGEKKVTFKITGSPINKAKVFNLPETVVFRGHVIDDLDYQLQVVNGDKTITLTEGKDYKVSYRNNATAGTGTIMFSGINGYTGDLKKTFKIVAYDIKADTENAVEVSLDSSTAYMKGSTVIEPKVTCFGQTLKKGIDYKLTYKNNTKLCHDTNSDKLPTVTITGIKNYRGSIAFTYTIAEQNIGLLSMSATDKVYQANAGKYVSKPVIKDVNGKVLTAGTDYEKELVYTYTTNTKLANGSIRVAGSPIGVSDILPAGTSVTVTAKGKGNYFGSISCTYRIVRADISKGSGKITAQIYTGKAIEPSKADIILKVGKTTLSDEDYEIVSYKNNIKKGTATVVVKGVGNYGGTKEIKFTIKSKMFSWWWR